MLSVEYDRRLPMYASSSGQSENNGFAPLDPRVRRLGESLIVSCLSEVQPEKALSSTERTLLGIMIDLSDEQLVNIEFGRVDMPVPMATFSMALQ